MNHGFAPQRGMLTFTGGTLDRADQLRVHPERLAVAWADPRACRVLLDGLDPCPTDDGLLATAPILPDADLSRHALLGVREDGRPVFVSLDVALPSEPPSFP